MKTQNNNQETNKSRFSKSTLGASAVLFGAILISLSVNAQNLWKEFSNSATYGKMALVMDGQLKETENADAVFEAIHAEIANQLYRANEVFITEAEETMEVESWMTEEANFAPAVNFNTVETEESLEIEDWMTIEEFFNSPEVMESAEPALDVESWMTDASLFNYADMETARYAEKIALEVETEEALAVEQWMTNENLFNGEEEALAIESWMTREEYFNSPEVLANEEALDVESWMLETENFSSQPQREQYAVK